MFGIVLMMNFLLFFNMHSAFNGLVESSSLPSINKSILGAEQLAIATVGVNNCLYVVNQVSCSVSVFFLNVDGSILSEASFSPIDISVNQTLSAPSGIAIVTIQNQKYAYISYQNNNQINMYTVNSDGNFGNKTVFKATSLVGSCFMKAVLINNQWYLYVANGPSGTISGFMIDNSTGYLTEITTSPFLNILNPIDLVFININNSWFVYYSDFYDNLIYGLNLNVNTGELSSAIYGIEVPSLQRPCGLSTISLAGTKYLFVANSGSNTVTVFSIDQAGNLTEVQNSPYLVVKQSNSISKLTGILAVESVRRLYAGSWSVNINNNNISVFNIQLLTNNNVNNIGIYPYNFSYNWLYWPDYLYTGMSFF